VSGLGRPAGGEPAPVAGPAVRTPGARCHEWRLPSTESSVTVLRRGLQAFLQGTSLSGEELYDLLLAACEAASNAIEHAQNPREPFFAVRTECDDDRVSIVVRDSGHWQQAVASPYRGRGLGMMQALADTSFAVRPEGTTVILRSRGGGVRPPSRSGPRDDAGHGP
jgi:anti-sigma regulatory factor (Ser/Thr protein kinase)